MQYVSIVRRHVVIAIVYVTKANDIKIELFWFFKSREMYMWHRKVKPISENW